MKKTAIPATARPARQRGFTLIELVVVVAIAAILMMVGIPSFQSLMASRAVAADMSAMGDTIRYARSEALKYGSPVTVCVSTGPMNPVPVCWDLGSGVTNYDWKVGWVVFVDRNADLVIDDSDIILRREQGMSAGMEDALATRRAMTFQTNGLSIGGGMQVTFKPKNQAAAQQKISCISNVGRITTIASGACP